MPVAKPPANWPESVDRHGDVTNSKVLPWDSQYNHYSAFDNCSDGLVCTDPFQEAYPDTSSFLFDRYSLLTLGGIPAENERVNLPVENCGSANNHPVSESHGAHLVAANGLQHGQQSPKEEPGTKFHREMHESENSDSWPMKTPLATRSPGHTLAAPPAHQASKLASETKSYSASESTRRKRAHCIVAKRYRETLNSKFLQLEKDVLNIGFDQDRKVLKIPCQPLNQYKRPEVLELAHQYISSLQEEVRSMKTKLQILRVATIPFETCRYTLPDDSFN